MTDRQSALNALSKFKRACRTDISRAAYDALKELEQALTASPAEPAPVGPIERAPGPWIGPDAELARACAIAAIKDYGTDDPVTHQRILRDGVWNDHVAVQAALAAIYHLRKASR